MGGIGQETNDLKVRQGRQAVKGDPEPELAG